MESYKFKFIENGKAENEFGKQVSQKDLLDILKSAVNTDAIVNSSLNGEPETWYTFIVYDKDEERKCDIKILVDPKICDDRTITELNMLSRNGSKVHNVNKKALIKKTLIVLALAVAGAVTGAAFAVIADKVPEKEKTTIKGTEIITYEDGHEVEYTPKGDIDGADIIIGGIKR